MLIITTIILILFNTIIVSSHPLIIGFLLIITRIIYGSTIYLTLNTSWLVYILIIVFVRGAIVIFIYMARLSSNEPIVILIKPLWKITIITLLSTSIIFVFTKQLKINSKIITNISEYFNKQSTKIIYKTYDCISLEMTLSLTMYLLVVLIVAVKLIRNFNKPLRASN